MYPQIFGKYVLEGELASGGMAHVFVATLRGAGGFEKRLAVKQIRPELASDPRFVERFIQEAKTAVELTHPNIVPVYELGVEGGVYYIAMELCPGVTLAELLVAEGALGLEAGAYVGVEVARALDYAHRRSGIVHRDVTPRNVLVDDEGAVRLIDFGIARPVAAGGKVEVFGSPGHMPPEQVRGATLTPAADVFALGALVIEACTGEAPFRRETERESLLSVESLPARPSEKNLRLASLDAVLLAAVEPDAARRLQSIDDVGRALREALRETDLGDLARDLGRRVRRVRGASRSELLASVPPVMKPHAGFPTQTFATRPLETRPLGSDEERGAAGGPPGANSLVGEALPNTRPLVQPEEKPRSESASPPPEAAHAFWGTPWTRILLAAAFLGVVLGWFWWGSPSSTSAEIEGAEATPSAAPVTSGSASVAPPPRLEAPAAPSPPQSPDKPSPEGPPPKPPSEPPLQEAPEPRGTPSPAPAASEPGSGTVALTAAPPAQVTIAGRQLVTPVDSLELPAGEYRATFTSPTWDGAISARVELEQGASRHVHADFTSEPPRIVVR